MVSVSSAVGARLEEPKAPREVGCKEGVFPSPEISFSIFELKKTTFGALWVLFLQLNENKTRCSAIAERPRCMVRYSCRQK